MENSETGPTPGSVAVPRDDVAKPAGHLSQPARLPRHRELRTKSPRRHQKGTKLQRRMGDHEQLSRDTDQRRLPGQREHLESSGSPSEPMEISPKRSERVCQLAARATGTTLLPRMWVISLMTTPFRFFFFFSTSQESALSTWTISSHSLRT